MLRRIKDYIKSVPYVDSLLRYYIYKNKIKNHRAYIGGKWDEIGKLQFDFLTHAGLKPNHYLLDIACGSLRGGRFFIQWLDEGHYLGIDHNKWLIEEGLKKELSNDIVKSKRPHFVVSQNFEFDKFQSQPDFALAISLFTHLTTEDILLCLKNLRFFINQNSQFKFYATFNDRKNNPGYVNPSKSGDIRHFEYTAEEMMDMGYQCGWKSLVLGDWGHPRGQQMILYY